jgi:ribose transport system ATP-binding protein
LPEDRAVIALRCDRITKRFEGITALDELTFTAPAGEVHAILGENGAGKSTFVKVLGGAVQADDGTIELFGKRAAIQSPRVAQAHGVWVAYQELSLASELTVAQNIWLTTAALNRLGLVPTRSLKRRTLDLVRKWNGPDVDPGRKLRDLSIAERQVVEILRTLAHDPQIVVLDEATAALPAEETEWALGVARQLASQGRLVLFISHRIREIMQIADRVTIFRNGRMVHSGVTAELTEAAMIEAMLGRRPQALYPGAVAAPKEDVCALAVRDLRARRLRGVSFDLREGEILGVGGLQGQGQSDLLHALFGAIGATGSISIHGRERRIRSPHDALSAGIALVPADRQLQGLLMSKTIRENVALPNLRQVTRLGFLSPRREYRFAEKVIASMNVQASGPDQTVSTLSGGNQQKAVVAKLLELGTPIILLDDFTRGIDVGTKADLFALLRRLTADGRSIVFYSSDAQELVEMCDRILVLRSGEVSAALEGPDKREENVMRAAFGLSLSA